MKYTVELNEETQEVLEVDTVQDVISLCLGFTFQLSLLAVKDDDAKRLIAILGKKLEAEYKETSNLN